jgi:integrase
LQERRIVHNLRRTAVRSLVREGGCTEKLAMDLSGHKTRSVFDRYNITSSDDRRKAMDEVAVRLTSQPEEPSNVVPLTKAP